MTCSNDTLRPICRTTNCPEEERVRLGDLHIKHRLAQRLIFGVDDLAGLIFIAGAQAGSFAGFGVHAIKGSIADTTPEQAVP
jgi:hypothetical protein